MGDSAGFGEQSKGYYIFFRLGDQYSGKQFKITGTKENTYDGHDLEMLFRIGRTTETSLTITSDDTPPITLTFKKAVFK